jgi:hypothetical protein
MTTSNHHRIYTPLTDATVGRHDLHPERVALGVDHQHALAAFDLLVGVVPARATLRAVRTLCVSMMAAVGRRLRSFWRRAHQAAARAFHWGRQLTPAQPQL